MPEELEVPDSDGAPVGTDAALELRVFTKLAEEMQRLGKDSQLRVLKMLGVLLQLPMGLGEARTASTHTPYETPTAPNRSSSSFSEDRSLSPKEFLLEKKPYTDVDRVACLAYYLTHYRATPHFKTLDLSKLNTEAAQIKFSNAAQAVDNASKSGLLAQASKGQKQLSAGGELYVEALPDREAAKEAFAHARPRRPKAKKAQMTNERDSSD